MQHSTILIFDFAHRKKWFRKLPKLLVKVAGSDDSGYLLIRSFN